MILAQQKARRDKARLRLEGEIVILTVNHDEVALSRFFWHWTQSWWEHPQKCQLANTTTTPVFQLSARAFKSAPNFSDSCKPFRCTDESQTSTAAPDIWLWRRWGKRWRAPGPSATNQTRQNYAEVKTALIFSTSSLIALRCSRCSASSWYSFFSFVCSMCILH